MTIRENSIIIDASIKLPCNALWREVARAAQELVNAIAEVRWRTPVGHERHYSRIREMSDQRPEVVKSRKSASRRSGPISRSDLGGLLVAHLPHRSEI